MPVQDSPYVKFLRFGFYTRFGYKYFKRNESAIRAAVESLLSKYFADVLFFTIRENKITLGVEMKVYYNNKADKIHKAIRLVIRQAMIDADSKIVKAQGAILVTQPLVLSLDQVSTFNAEELVIMIKEKERKATYNRRNRKSVAKQRDWPLLSTEVEGLIQLVKDAHEIIDKINNKRATINNALDKHPAMVQHGYLKMATAEGLYAVQDIDDIPELLKKLKTALEIERGIEANRRYISPEALLDF
jgi:hypothetical protein